jgi:hypothetical protein
MDFPGLWRGRHEAAGISRLFGRDGRALLARADEVIE